MEHITFFLKDPCTLYKIEEDIKKDIVSAVYAIIALTIQPSAVKIRGKKVFISTSPTAKNMIFIHKREILGFLENTKKKKKDIKEIF